jgi:nucleotide-binding universal stress UspA family protein
LPELEALYVVTDFEAPERAEAYVREELGRFIVRHAIDSPLKVVPRTVAGYVEDEILLRIREWEPDLVVLGTHGRSGFERFLVGSVAARILRDGGANVLIVPPAAAREQHVEAVHAQQEALVG